MKVSEIKPYGKKIDVSFRVENKGEPREVVARLDNSQHRVSEALVGDETASILLTLWDDAIDSVEEGKTYALENGYTTVFKNSLRLNVGRYGTLKEADENVESVNTENNLSEKEISVK